MRRNPITIAFTGVLLLGALFLFSGFTSSASAATLSAHTQQVQKPASVSPHTSCPPTLRQGSTGSWVKELQNQLNVDYYYYDFDNYPYDFKPYLSVDGSFGPLTTNAVKDFQYIYTPTQIDGVVGPKTWHALGYC